MSAPFTTRDGIQPYCRYCIFCKRRTLPMNDDLFRCDNCHGQKLKTEIEKEFDDFFRHNIFRMFHKLIRDYKGDNKVQARRGFEIDS